MPELGSKISLISKADIRYEGRLFTVDPQECTIALANVRSFGTEDRETQYPILPQPTIYDYILFRGSDIKDIRVVNNVAIPNDPAIMQMHLPPNQMLPQQQQQFPLGYGPMGGVGGPHMGQPQSMQQFGQFGALQSGNIGQMGPPQQQQQPGNMQIPGSGSSPSSAPGGGSNANKQKQTSELNKSNLLTKSRSGTPNNMARKSPTSEMGVQTNQNQQQNAQGKDKSGNRDNKPNQRNNNQQQRERRDSGRNEGQQMQQQQRGDNNDHKQGGYNRNYRQDGMNRGPGGNQQQQQQHHQNNINQQQNAQGGVGKPINTVQNGGPRNAKPPLKFENDYDFEQANTKFEELRSQLAKIKVGEELKQTEQVNGEVSEKKDDSGNETGAGDNETEGDDSGYDKRKSFFDNISCEAVERSKGKTQRTDWRQERKLNSETFGMSMARRGTFRGRGGYYNRGPANYHRGGQQNFRGSNQNYRSIRGGYNNNNNRNQHQNGGRDGTSRSNSQGATTTTTTSTTTQSQPPTIAAVVA
ncbi:unnamed protein product, partial [Diamesa serratosioi]